MSKSAETVAEAVMLLLLLLQALYFIATCTSTLLHCLRVPLPPWLFWLQSWTRPLKNEAPPMHLLAAPTCFHLVLQKKLELFLGRVGKRNNMSSAAESPAERGRPITEASREACTKQGEMLQAYGKARDAKKICTCILPFHPAASARSKSLDMVVGQVLAAGLRPWKAAVMMWRIGRRSLRCRWTPAEPKAAEQGEGRWSCVNVFPFLSFCVILKPEAPSDLVSQIGSQVHVGREGRECNLK